jgi:hypothetical protein
LGAIALFVKSTTQREQSVLFVSATETKFMASTAYPIVKPDPAYSFVLHRSQPEKGIEIRPEFCLISRKRLKLFDNKAGYDKVM